MFFIYNEHQFDEWFDDFCEYTNIQIDVNLKQFVKSWAQTPNIVFYSYFSLLGYSTHCECASLNDSAIIKASTETNVELLYQKYKSHPVFGEYIVPTFCYKMPTIHAFSKPHIELMESRHWDMRKLWSQNTLTHLILQPKCIPLDLDAYNEWLAKEHALIEYANKLDVYNIHNIGYWNGIEKFFDW